MLSLRKCETSVWPLTIPKFHWRINAQRKGIALCVILRTSGLIIFSPKYRNFAHDRLPIGQTELFEVKLHLWTTFSKILPPLCANARNFTAVLQATTKTGKFRLVVHTVHARYIWTMHVALSVRGIYQSHIGAAAWVTGDYLGILEIINKLHIILCTVWLVLYGSIYKARAKFYSWIRRTLICQACWFIDFHFTDITYDFFTWLWVSFQG